jgi:hypothetical protein
VYRRPVLVNVVVVWWRMEMMMTVFFYLFSSLVSGCEGASGDHVGVFWRWCRGKKVFNYIVM